jgi:hypothetical protein
MLRPLYIMIMSCSLVSRNEHLLCSVRLPFDFSPCYFLLFSPTLRALIQLLQSMIQMQEYARTGCYFSAVLRIRSFVTATSHLRVRRNGARFFEQRKFNRLEINADCQFKAWPFHVSLTEGKGIIRNIFSVRY